MKKFIKVSAIAHISVLILIVTLPSILSPKYRRHMRPVHTVELISHEELAPPRPKAKDQRPKTKKQKPKKKRPIKKKRPVLKPTVAKLKTPSLEEKLSRKLKDFKEPDIKSESTSFQEPHSYTPQFKATISSTSDFPFQWYLDFIQGKISSLWRQPQMVIAKQYSSMISFTILKDGQVGNIRIKRPSGMTNFDRSAMQAVEQAQPLPPLPSGYKHQQLVVNVEFRLE